MNQSELTGTVIKKRFAAGSKSERDAVILQTAKGDEYVLRREGGNPFSDSALDALVGKQVRLKGLVHGYTLIFSQCERLAQKAD